MASVMCVYIIFVYLICYAIWKREEERKKVQRKGKKEKKIGVAR